jgi:serine/threonine protein kinase
MIEIGLSADETSDPYAGKQIDQYKIIQEIGHGGMGTVYLANRADESFDKQVAVKLIKRGMDTNAVLKRFVMERQILANLEHPNIASLLDGGSTEDGLPYLVMEYVEGLPITRYCDSHDLDTNGRLELFQKVCAAVSYAHTNLVVHRDIKPSNILVAEDGTPKLLDFGIAKLLNPELLFDTEEATATMFRVMTPEYASPEQVRGLPVTTASDVYSLGVVLYELLTGRRPFKLESHMPEEAAKIILTEEPPKPSSVVDNEPVDQKTFDYDQRPTADDDRRTFRPRVQDLRSLRGDLDNIILKALRKEPERRYPTVQEFSEDIRRHLAGLPVTATADTVSYRMAKFVKRHRTGVLAAGIILLTLISSVDVPVMRQAGRDQRREVL